VLKNTTQICALITIVGIGSPIQLIAWFLNIKPDNQLAGLETSEQADRKIGAKAEEGKEGDDDFQQVRNIEAEGENPFENQSETSQTDMFVRAGVDNEEAAVDLINKSFEDLISERTYPNILRNFKNFDKAFMMPVFKRKTRLSSTERVNGSQGLSSFI